MRNYRLEKGPLYRLRNKRRLADLLNITFERLEYLSKVQPYNSFQKTVAGKIRNIDEPEIELKKVQKRVKNLLSRIELPPWLFSGKKGVSYIDNARFHACSPYVVTCDIKSFYPNCTKERIFQTFKYRFMMSDDVAWVLANLLSFKDQIPTGSPSSQIVAFWAYYPTFLRIYNKISSHDCLFSLYVDDISISSQRPIASNLINEINYEFKKVGHGIKLSKTRWYGARKHKLVTGVIISPDKTLKIPNKRRKKLKESLENNISQASILGQITSGQMIEKNYFRNTEKVIKNNKLIIDK